MGLTSRDLLRARRNPDGGWSAGIGGPSTTEATALALLAFDAGGEAPEAETARAWLRARQRHDGAWPPQDGVPLTSWMTSLAVLALSGSPRDRTRVRDGGRWLLAQEGRGYPWWTRLLVRLFPSRSLIRLDPDLVGWPWLAGTFSWVEPTAYALIALQRIASLLPAEATRHRLAMGQRMILDRVCPDGGWNYGNSVVLGEELGPYPDTTALGLIALQAVGARAEVARSRRALRVLMESHDSALSLSLAILALQLYGEDVADLRDRLRARIGVAHGLDTRSLALAALALDADRRPFRQERG